MNKFSIELTSVLQKLIYEYEATFGHLHFTLKRKEQQFVFSSINQKLLDKAKISEDAIGKTLDELRYVTGDFYEYIYANFIKAFQEKTIIYYFSPATNQDIYLIVLLEPWITRDGEIDHIEGRCAALSKSDFETIQFEKSLPE